MQMETMNLGGRFLISAQKYNHGWHGDHLSN